MSTIIEANQKVSISRGMHQANQLTAFMALHSRACMSTFLTAVDIVCILSVYMVALELRHVLSPEFEVLKHLRYLPLVVLFPIIYAWRGLYPAVGMGVVEEIRRLSASTTVGFVSIAAFTFIMQSPPTFSRFAYLFTWMGVLFAVPLSRCGARYAAARYFHLWGEPVAIIGSRIQIEKVLPFLKQAASGIKPVVVFDSQLAQTQRSYGIPVFPLQALEEKRKLFPVRSAFVAYNDLCEIEGIRDMYKDLFERVTLINIEGHGASFSGVRVKYFDKIIGLEIKQNLLDRWAQREKRALDLIGSLLGLILLLPFLVLIGLMVFIDSPGRIFYRQERIGKGGKVFKLLKYRTMQLNADQVLQSQLERDPRLKREWDQYQKLKNDPRITRVGRLLRRFSLDELPQLWNVFLGDMSLVGPRPMMVKQQEVYGEPFRHYVRVTPGITGMWQINGRNHTTFARRAELDVQYVANWSIWLDIYILARTIWVVVKRDGAC